MLHLCISEGIVLVQGARFIQRETRKDTETFPDARQTIGYSNETLLSIC